MKVLAILGITILTLDVFGQSKLNSHPDIPGYITLTGDFHVHTDFSDGVVWPTFRIDEAVREGIDIISITDQRHGLVEARDLDLAHALVAADAICRSNVN